MSIVAERPAILNPKSVFVRPDSPLAWIGLLLCLVPQFVRAMSSSTLFPGWDLDPLLFPLDSAAIAHAGSMLCDALVLAGAACIFLVTGTKHNLLLRLPAVGIGAVIVHLAMSSTPSSQSTASAWLASIVGAYALWHLAHVDRYRQLVLGLLMGFIALLALRGLTQVYIDHPASVASFEQSKARVFASNGWAEGSSQALAYERRLLQPEASGWFGLANVYATFAAGICIGALGILLANLRSTPRTTTIAVKFGLGTLAMLAFVALMLASSKGGYLAAFSGLAVGCSLLILIRISAKYPRVGCARVAGLVGVMAVVGPMLLVAARGLMGERFGELSLLFRWFYVDASARVFALSPFVGIGPAGYQQAFSLVKSPLCPEDVTSPHCIVWDWISMLGLGGLSWVVLLVFAAWSVGSSALKSAALPMTTLNRNDYRLLIGLPAAAVLVAMWFESPLVTPEMLAVRFIGGGLWMFAAISVARCDTASPLARASIAAMAAALIAHGQIDLAGSSSLSTGLWSALIAVCALPTRQSPSVTNRRDHTLAVMVLALTCFVGYNTYRAWGWERELRWAANLLRPVGEIDQRLEALFGSTSGQRSTDSLAKVAKDLSIALGNPVEPAPIAVQRARAALWYRNTTLAANKLGSVAAQFDDYRTRREASRLHLQLAEFHSSIRDEAGTEARLDAAVALVDGWSPPLVRRARSLVMVGTPGPQIHWLASLLERRAARTSDGRDASQTARAAQLRIRAIEARIALADRDPYNLENVVRLARLCKAQGPNYTEATRLWAVYALQLHNWARLDQAVRGLNEKDRAEMDELASSSNP